MMNKRQYLKKFAEYVPSSSQTLSKNPSQFVIGVTPPAITCAKGVYMWDMDGKKYLDLMLGLGPMIFGYANPRIDRAVKHQIDKGVIYSLPSTLELELAQLLRKVVPCAEMSRFALNGNDVTSGAIRLARHITKRDHIAKCGYHGWQDWSICTKSGRNAGVPEIIKTMTHDFVYNDTDSLEAIFKQYPNQIAAVILEPAASEKPKNDFLKKVEEITRRHGAILIFDEMVTGFRWALGGAQEYFGVTPDLACFGKAISNGYPIAALSGKSAYMKRMDEVFVSMTLGGSTLGLVAAIETIKMMQEFGDVHQHMHELGDYFIAGGNRIAQAYALPITFVGYGPHPIVTCAIQDDYLARVLKTFIYQEFHEAGIFFSTSMMIGYMHTRTHIDGVLQMFESIVKKVQKITDGPIRTTDVVASGKDYKKLESKLHGDVMAPRTVRAQQ